ncbi:hypothetical protein ACHHYP_05738 [Achlya hypogyna]|uniref:Uncharacterized protein n=1 Tax=Achlya hypogyna TaxID=1202772 RepID=A0A1V9YWV0_ACHHY|nr:hypothetical protein ACHHYP_05738 [Achlya hypogyna]
MCNWWAGTQATPLRFKTITYLLQKSLGQILHVDFCGHRGKLWLHLPCTIKLTDLKYQEICRRGFGA